jgi:hypothetical protein
MRASQACPLSLNLTYANQTGVVAPFSLAPVFHYVTEGLFDPLSNSLLFFLALNASEAVQAVRSRARLTAG